MVALEAMLIAVTLPAFAFSTLPQASGQRSKNFFEGSGEGW